MFCNSFIKLTLLVIALQAGEKASAFTVRNPRVFQGRTSRPVVIQSGPRPELLTQLSLFRRLFGRKKKDVDNASDVVKVMPKPQASARRQSSRLEEEAAVCVIGGGVSGLTAATEAAKILTNNEDKVILLEASPSLGGRVQSDKTDDGFVLDRGFAVFIDQYPAAKAVLDFEKLNLGKFLPGALVKVKGRNKLARVADPLRQPEDIFAAIFAPVGSLLDKILLLPLIIHAKTKSIEEIFLEKEKDTLSELQDEWGLGDTILDRFFRPFLEGIYLAKLDEQSSRMFHFIFKMFSEGSATLPEGGMGAVSEQLERKASEAGVALRTNSPVAFIEQDGDSFVVRCPETSSIIRSKSVVFATDGQVAQKLLSQVDGFQSLSGLAEQPQRSVGCLYYSFEGDEPVTEPILILNGIGEDRGTKIFPVNNVCFPSAVSKGYAPEGKGLCSVTVLKDAMDYFEGRDDELDRTVRTQLGTWFPDYKDDIKDKWELKKIYRIKNAQPSQLRGPFPANINGGRDCNSFRGKSLPKGMFVCGDHMATATLNGALESGVNAGKAAGKAAN